MPQRDYNLPPKRNNVLIIGLSIGLGLVLLAGGTVGAITYLGSSGRPAAAQPGGGTSFPTTQPWQSDSPSSGRPSSDPSAEPSWDPSSSSSDDPAEPATDPTDGPFTSDRPSAGSPIAHTEFDDWKINLEGVRFSANKVAGWTYDTCDPVDAQGVLAKNKCERAIQIGYTSYRGHLKAVQLAMTFPTEQAAQNAATKLLKLNARGVNIRSDMTFSTYAYGAIRATSAKKYVVVTIVTADKTAEAKAEKFHLYLQADAMSYFMLRDVTITS